MTFPSDPTATSSLAPLAIAALGLLFGVLLTVIGVAIVALVYLTNQQRQATLAMRDLTTRTLARNTTAINQLRTETALALSGMDVDRMHEASHAVQASARSLASITSRLAKALFTQPGMAGTVDQFGNANDGLLDPAPLDQEAMQDAAMLEQWNARAGRGSSSAGFGGAGDYNDPALRPRAPMPSVPPLSTPFARWHAEQQAREDAAAGRTSPIPPPTLPDLDDAHDLDAEQGADASQLASSQVPGFTDDGTGGGGTLA